MRLAAKKRGDRRKSLRLSVGEALGMTPRRGEASNLHEARALQMGRAAAANLDEHRLAGRKGKGRHGKTRHSRGRSLPPKARPAKSAGPAKRNKAKSVHGTPRRASQVRNSLEARELTRDIFNSGDDDTDDGMTTPPPPLDGDDESVSEGKEEDGPVSNDKRLSLIATPASQRSPWEPRDDEFIAPEGDPSVYDDDDDGDYAPSRSTDTDESNEPRRGARKRREAREDHVPNPAGIPFVGPRRGAVRGRPAGYPGAVQAGARKTSPVDAEAVMEPGARKPGSPMGGRAGGRENDGIRVTARYNSMEAQPRTPETPRTQRKGKERERAKWRHSRKKQKKSTKKHRKRDYKKPSKKQKKRKKQKERIRWGTSRWNTVK